LHAPMRERKRMHAPMRERKRLHAPMRERENKTQSASTLGQGIQKL
jgi:hypothetical protein